MKEYRSENTLGKRVFSFLDDDRALLEKIKIDSEVSIRIKDEHGEEVAISFRVTRNAYLGKNTRWIYGVILDTPNNEYRQIEIKLRKGAPKEDTVEVFLQAPPATINRLR